MIVQPDFLDHWKTHMLIDLLKDELAPIYLIRLWAYCQNRKTNTFSRTNPAMLKHICQASQDASHFEKCMIESGFVELIDDQLVAHDWDEVNASLIASWKNGKTGGRKRKQSKTQQKPTGYPQDNPTETHGLPSENPSAAQAEAIRLDKRREEKRRDNTPLAPQGGDEEGFELDEPTSSGPPKRKTWNRKQLAAESYTQYPHFLTWWAAYPRKDGKRKAFETWIQLELEFLDQEPLLKILKAQSVQDQWVKDGGQFAPMASTYLNQRRFEDEAPEKNTQPATDFTTSPSSFGAG